MQQIEVEVAAKKRKNWPSRTQRRKKSEKNYRKFTAQKGHFTRRKESFRHGICSFCTQEWMRSAPPAWPKFGK